MAIPNWVVKAVTPQHDYTLLLTFADGQKRIYDARPLLKKKLYAQLQNLDVFQSAQAFCGTVVWRGDIDIAPEHLYECSKPISS